VLDGDPGLGMMMSSLDEVCAAKHHAGDTHCNREPRRVSSQGLKAEDTIRCRLDGFGADKDLVYVVAQPETDWSELIRAHSQFESSNLAVALHRFKLVAVDPTNTFLDTSM
jgi:hypothetical protein